jgi:Na+-transporting NADH:ubiquinone oxidoreductase subunit B
MGESGRFANREKNGNILPKTKRGGHRMAEAKKQPVILWQLPMQRVLIALLPAALASIWFFGWRSLVVLAVANAAAFLTEFAFTRARKEPVTQAVFVTGVLLALSLPPSIPYWIAAVGAVFAIIFGKMVFGGFGRNVFNPALTGRVFIYVSFAVPMTARWVQPLTGTAGPLQLPASWGGFTRFAADAVTSATPLNLLHQGQPVDILPLLWGNVSGCLGETSAVLLVLGGIYILATKAANWRIVVSQAIAFMVVQSALWLAGVRGAADPLRAMLSGSFLIGMLFMSTDPISAAQTQGGRWIYGALIGLLWPLIRTFSIWPEATGFAILLGNTFAGIIDYAVRQLKEKAKRKAQAGPGGGA